MPLEKPMIMVKNLIQQKMKKTESLLLNLEISLLEKEKKVPQ